MRLLPVPSPCPPDWRVEWDAINEQFEWIRSMKGCPQDHLHHAEGDLWIHMRMVCEALAGLADWRSLGEADRELVFTAALLHDVAKPACTRTENGRITSRGHSVRGAIEARRILWESGADMVAREHVCGLVRYHQMPLHAIERPEPQKTVLRISQQARCDFLAALAKADSLGRICEDQEGLLVKIGLFEELCREHSCLDRPWGFPSPLSRFEYFRREGRDPNYKAHDESRCEVVLMSGLPGSGKDTWLTEFAQGMPVISLDEIRQELGVGPTGNQGSVIHEAKERARVFLRSHTGFAWNATNLTRDRRSQLIDLFTDYHARVRIVHVESPYRMLFERNAGRVRAVPRQAIEEMLDIQEVPDVTEAPMVEWWENAEGLNRRV